MGGVVMSFDSLLRASGRVGAFSTLEAYYEGKKRLDALGVSLPPDVRVLEMVVNWPRLAVDILAECLKVEGFVAEDADDATRAVWRAWQAGNMDAKSGWLITESLVQGSGYMVIGWSGDGQPVTTVHSPIGMAVERDGMGTVIEALRRFKPLGSDEKHIAHYLPGVTEYYSKNYYSNQWEKYDERATGISRVPVLHMVNSTRIGDTDGRTAMQDVIPFADAGSRSFTNLQLAQELLAMPLRYLFGDGVDEQFKDSQGRRVEKIQAYLGHFITGPSGASAGQLPGADLAQIINAIKVYALTVSSLTGIPPTMLGVSTDNPVSAEAMRAAKERLITRAETCQTVFGDVWEDWAKINAEMLGVYVPPTIETIWRDPATPSQSAKAANILQAHAQGVVSARTARAHLPLTPEQRAYEDAQDTDLSGLRKSIGAE